MKSREKYRSILDSLSQLCIQPALFETLVIRILTKLDLLSDSTKPSADGDVDMAAAEALECSVAYAWDLLNCLSGVIDVKLEAKHVDVVKHFHQIVPRVSGLAVSAAAPKSADCEPLFRDRRLLSSIGRIIENLTWELSAECVYSAVMVVLLMGFRRQSKHFGEVYRAFELGEMSVAVMPSTPEPGSSSMPLRVSSLDLASTIVFCAQSRLYRRAHLSPSKILFPCIRLMSKA